MYQPNNQNNSIPVTSNPGYNTLPVAYGQPTTTYGQPTTTYGQPAPRTSGYTSVIDGLDTRRVQPQPRPSAGKRQKIVEVIVEKPVVVEKYVDVIEEVIIERPVENRIEKDIYVEKIVEVPVERVVENDVEVVREEIKEIVIEKRVEVERYVDIPVEKITEIPIDVVREVEVRVPVHKDRYVDRTLIKPIETRVQENVIYVDKPVVQDQVVEKRVEVPYERIVDRINEVRVNRDVNIEVEKLITVDKVVEQRVEKPYDVYVDKVYTREVEVPIKVDKYVDRPYEVVKEVIVNVPVERVVEKKVTVPVDKVIEVPVDVRVEIPVRNEIHKDMIYETVREGAVLSSAAVDIPNPVYVDKAVALDHVVEDVRERVQERRIEIPFGRVVEVPVARELAVEAFRIVEVPQAVDRTVDIAVPVEKYVEVPREDVVEKLVTLNKIIEKPVLVPKYVDRYIDKYVDVKVEVPNPVFKEVQRFDQVDVRVDLVTRVQRANYRQTAQTVPVNTIIRRNGISALQKRRFQESSLNLANLAVESEKLRSQLTYLREKGGNRPAITNGVNASAAENDRLRQLVFQLEQSLRQKTAERDQLRASTSTAADLDVKTTYDGQDIPRLQEHIRRVRAENENLRRIATKGAFQTRRTLVGNRVSHQETKREAPRHTHAGTYSTSPIRSSARTTVLPTTTYATNSIPIASGATYTAGTRTSAGATYTTGTTYPATRTSATYLNTTNAIPVTTGTTYTTGTTGTTYTTGVPTTTIRRSAGYATNSGAVYTSTIPTYTTSTAVPVATTGTTYGTSVDGTPATTTYRY